MKRITRTTRWTLALWTLLALLTPAAGARAEEPGDPGGITLRRAAPPSPLERARVERWRQIWRAETRPLGPILDAALDATSGPELLTFCRPLAEAVLAIDRKRVLPVPVPAADLQARRGLRAVTLGAVACLEKRPYAARGRLREARERFDRAGHLLRRYRRRPTGPLARPLHDTGGGDASTEATEATDTAESAERKEPIP